MCSANNMPEYTNGKINTNAAPKYNSKLRYSRVLPINVQPLSDTEENTTTIHASFTPAKNAKRIASHSSSTDSQGSYNDLSSRTNGMPVDADGGNETYLTSNHHSHRRSPTSNERIIELRGTGKHTWIPPVNQLDTPPGASLIMRRLLKTKERQSAEAQKQSQSGLRELQQTFVARQPILDSSSWEFWTSVVGDYDSVARSQPERLRKAIQNGFPNELRGLLWQIISSSKSAALEQLYAELVLMKDAPCSAAIAKDLDRTPMAKHVETDALARILRAYSLFDPEVGYTQGMAFIAVPLLLELNEPEAFSLFVQLMKTYDFRSVFLSEMPGLHLKLYQFDRLIEDTLESVHTHLRRQGIQSSMYASQWFLTMFAYRFPPSLVKRIFDITIAEGLEALLRFAFALMEAASQTILSLEGLDNLLPFLKERIFDKFEGCENELVKLASQIELLPQVLSKFELEFQELNRLEKERMEQMDTLRNSNARLSLQNKNLEATLEALDGEHLQIVDKMIKKRWDMAHLQDENQELKQELEISRSEHSNCKRLQSELEVKANKVSQLENENEELQRELAFLRQSKTVKSIAELLKELEELREVNKRYETQLGSLQESLASALENH